MNKTSQKSSFFNWNSREHEINEEAVGIVHIIGKVKDGKSREKEVMPYSQVNISQGKENKCKL